MDAAIHSKLTTHVNRIGEEVAGVSDQEDQATLDLWVSPDVSEFEQQTGRDANHNSDRQAAKEDQHEDTDGLEQTQNGQFAGIRARLVLLRRLKQHNRNSIVQDGLSKDDRVKFRVNFIRVEDGQDCYRIGGAQCCANAHCFDETDVQALQGDARPEPENYTQH
jgi:hypothetical protein